MTTTRQYIWVFVVLLSVWSLLVFLRPTFVLKPDKSLNYQQIFWFAVLASASIVFLISWWSHRKQVRVE